MKIAVCQGKSCSEKHSKYILMRLQKEQEFDPSLHSVELTTCLCQGKCTESPTVVFDETILTRMNPVSAAEEMKRRVKTGREKLRVQS